MMSLSKKRVLASVAGLAVLAGGGYACYRFGAASAVCPMEGRTAGQHKDCPMEEQQAAALPPGHPKFAAGEKVPGPPLDDARLKSGKKGDCPYLSAAPKGAKSADMQKGPRSAAPVEQWLDKTSKKSGGSK